MCQFWLWLLSSLVYCSAQWPGFVPRGYFRPYSVVNVLDLSIPEPPPLSGYSYGSPYPYAFSQPLPYPYWQRQGSGRGSGNARSQGRQGFMDFVTLVANGAKCAARLANQMVIGALHGGTHENCMGADPGQLDDFVFRKQVQSAPPAGAPAESTAPKYIVIKKPPAGVNLSALIPGLSGSNIQSSSTGPKVIILNKGEGSSQTNSQASYSVQDSKIQSVLKDTNIQYIIIQKPSQAGGSTGYSIPEPDPTNGDGGNGGPGNNGSSPGLDGSGGPGGNNDSNPEPGANNGNGGPDGNLGSGGNGSGQGPSDNNGSSPGNGGSGGTSGDSGNDGNKGPGGNGDGSGQPSDKPGPAGSGGGPGNGQESILNPTKNG